MSAEAGGGGRTMTRRRSRTAAGEAGGGGGIMTRGRKRAASELGEGGSPSETTCEWLPKSNYRQLQCRRSGDGWDFQWLEPSPSRNETLPPNHPPKPIGVKALPPALSSNPTSSPPERKPVFNGFVKTESVFVPMDTIPLIDPTLIAAHSGAEVRVRVAVQLQGTAPQIHKAKYFIKDLVHEFDDPVFNFSCTSGSGWVYKKGSFPTKVVCLSQVVSPGKLIQDEYYEDKLKLVRNEGEKYGKVLKVIIPRPGPKGELVHGVGKVFLEYEDVVGSCKARLALDGMKFGECEAVAIFYPEDKFARGEYYVYP